MKLLYPLFTIVLFCELLSAPLSPKEIFRKNQDAICLVSFYQNLASDSKIGAYDKIKQHRIGILVNASGLVLVSSDIYPVSLDIVSTGMSFLSGLPTDFEVKLNNDKKYAAKFLGKDDQAQIAFIQITGEKEDNFPYILFKDTENIGIADSIFVLELLTQNYEFAPLFTAHTVDAVVKSPRKKFLVNNYTNALSAGGLVLDSQGDAIGVTLKQSFNYSYTTPNDFEEYHKEYLEIAPSEWFVHLIENPPNLQEKQIIQKSWLGIRMQGLSEELQKYWNVKQNGGIIINQVYPESPAEKSKLKTGDIILFVNDSTLLITKDEETDKFRNIIRSIPPGEEIQIKIFREGKILTKKIQLTAAPKAIGLAESYPVPDMGFELRELTRDILYQENLPLNTPGVFVYQVDRASPAGIGGLMIGDILQEINNREIKDLESAQKIIVEEKEITKSYYMLKVLTNRSTRFVFLEFNK
jgi:serine protease Do